MDTLKEFLKLNGKELDIQFPIEWEKEYDKNNNEIYFENSKYVIRNNRPKVTKLTLYDIKKKLNITGEIKIIEE